MRTLMSCLALAAILATCILHEEDVSTSPRARELVGQRYQVVGRILAYGVRRHSGAAPDHVVLTAPPGLAGPEVAFEEAVAAGAEITLLKVLKTNRLLDNPCTLVVRLEGTAWRTSLPVRLELYNENGGPGRLSLNPEFYRRLANSRAPEASRHK